MMRRQDFLYERGGVSRPWQFEDALRREIARARRYGTTFSFVLVALDDAEHLRESLGPVRVGHLVKRVGEFTAQVTRTTDLIGHHHDGQVAALLPETAAEGAFTVAERLRRLVEQAAHQDLPRRVPVSVSIGVSSFRDDPALGAESMVYEAEMALREAQREGGNRAKIFRAA